MGTRAIITKDGKPFIATHWDGDPESLGDELIGKTTDEEIMKVAENHTIDFIHKDFMEQVNKERYASIAKKTNGKYTAKDIAELHKQDKQLTFEIMGASDYPIDSIDEYDDWAEYQYDLTKGNWQFRELGGSWKEADKSGKFYPLTKEGIEKFKVVSRMED